MAKSVHTPNTSISGCVVQEGVAKSVHTPNTSISGCVVQEGVAKSVHTPNTSISGCVVQEGVAKSVHTPNTSFSGCVVQEGVAKSVHTPNTSISGCVVQEGVAKSASLEEEVKQLRGQVDTLYRNIADLAQVSCHPIYAPCTVCNDWRVYVQTQFKRNSCSILNPLAATDIVKPLN